MTDERLDDRAAGSGWFAAPNDVFALDHPHDILVSVYLLRRAGPDGSAWPSIARIAADVKISRASVKRAIGRLQTRGWLDVERRTDAKGDPASSLYRWTGPAWRRLDIAEVGSGRPYPGSGRPDRSGQPAPRSTTQVEGPPDLLVLRSHGSTDEKTSIEKAADGAVKRAVDAFRALPGVRASGLDGGIIAGLVGRHGVDVVLGVIQSEDGLVVASADNPLMCLAAQFRRFRGRGRAGETVRQRTERYASSLRRGGVE